MFKKMILAGLITALTSSAFAGVKDGYFTSHFPNNDGKYIFLVVSEDDTGGELVDPILKFQKCEAETPLRMNEETKSPIVTNCKSIGSSKGYHKSEITKRYRELSTEVNDSLWWTIGGVVVGAIIGGVITGQLTTSDYYSGGASFGNIWWNHGLDTAIVDTLTGVGDAFAQGLTVAFVGVPIGGAAGGFVGNRAHYYMNIEVYEQIDALNTGLKLPTNEDNLNKSPHVDMAQTISSLQKILIGLEPVKN